MDFLGSTVRNLSYRAVLLVPYQVKSSATNTSDVERCHSVAACLCAFKYVGVRKPQHPHPNIPFSLSWSFGPPSVMVTPWVFMSYSPTNPWLFLLNHHPICSPHPFALSLPKLHQPLYREEPFPKEEQPSRSKFLDSELHSSSAV